MCRDACIFIQTGVRDAFIHTYAVTHLHRCAVTDAYSYTSMFVTHPHTDVSTQSLRGAYCIFKGAYGHLARLIPPWVISHQPFLRNAIFQNPSFRMPSNRRDVPSQRTCVARRHDPLIFATSSHTYPLTHTHMHTRMPANPHTHIRETKPPIHPPPPT